MKKSMAELKLARLPDRTPVKITIAVPPGLYNSLQCYAELYKTQFGQAEPVTELIPYMLNSFLESDRAFVKASRGRVHHSTMPSPAESAKQFKAETST